MNSCPNCHHAISRQFTFPEGNINICDFCCLQWGSVDKSHCGGFITSTNEHYLNPSSLKETSQYAPYLDFFSVLDDKLGKRSLRILDIGCGGGGFVKTCLEFGHDAWGVEANVDLARYMPETTRSRVHFGLAEEFYCQGDPFDVITFWDSFEHMEKAFDLLERLKCYLKPGGLVYLRVNNNWDIFNILTLMVLRIAPGIGKRLLKACFNFPDHCWNFSRKAMCDMLEGRGWSTIIVHIGETPASRLSSSLCFRLVIRVAYLVNTMLGGGKIGNYYVKPAKQNELIMPN